MRRRALLTAATAAAATSLAGCLARTDATYDLMVRGWQSLEDRSFEVFPETGETIRIEFQQTQSHGASFDIYRPDPMESSHPVFDIGLTTDGRSPTSPVEYEVEEGGKHTILVHPCCASGGGVSRAWVRIYVV